MRVSVCVFACECECVCVCVCVCVCAYLRHDEAVRGGDAAQVVAGLDGSLVVHIPMA
jgi:hypothetical protein